MATEVYSCRDGQEIKQGRLDFAEIENRSAAEADARRRCAQDPTLKRVVYYRIDSGGGSKLLLSYENPNCLANVRQTRAGASRTRPSREAETQAKTQPAAKPGLVDRIKGALGLS
jgi:hypothetical protein